MSQDPGVIRRVRLKSIVDNLWRIPTDKLASEIVRRHRAAVMFAVEGTNRKDDTHVVAYFVGDLQSLEKLSEVGMDIVSTALSGSEEQDGDFSDEDVDGDE